MPPAPFSKLEYIRWTNLNSVHNDSFDAQHRNLCELINDLYHGVSVASGTDPLDAALRSLDAILEYTDYHFVHEE